ncbi:serine/threonine-protein kinase [Polyangium aurulentum]|uniref:serine/threonine-protein kinase n=1 Tax=Polyangium aurulentum TaxID=2567896 RepID=UPI0010AE5BEF|nr:serine/threonine-protein kinase [Polyangium aurulentum]UQA60435.1 protein kinase [Polyangium aurulentum]
MKTGSVLQDRFELEAFAGAGGMGRVYRARDRVTGQLVALKFVPVQTEVDAARFSREARVLAALSHPGIVGYLAHDVAASGELYLAMEWLPGEDLANRLARGRLTVSESVTLARRVAEALGIAHARGIVHRDLKPSNIYLVDRDVARPKILDFGIACLDDGTRVTGSKTVIGTPGYMAPEQARSVRDIDARADIFALGSVLFECLTGVPAFQGNNLMAVLAKILFEDSPRLRTVRPDLPAALDALVARMLAKEPETRPRNGAAVAEELAALDLSAEESEALLVETGAASLTTGERRAVSLVVLSAGRITTKAEASGVTSKAPQLLMAEPQMRRVTSEFGGRLEFLADGSAVVVFAGASVPTDQAVQATQCALSLSEHAAGQPIALATALADSVAQIPVGAAIDRAARMLGTHTEEPPDVERATDNHEPPRITLDEVTAGLLDARFDVRTSRGKFILYGERELLKEMRMLLGKPTPCVGRDWELRVLEEMCIHSMQAPAAQAALVTAPAGTGKSRLAFELLPRLRQRGEPISIWVARGDPLRTGSPFGLLGQAIRGAFGIQEGESLDVRRDKLQACVAERIVEADRRRVTEFLGEIIGTPMPDDDSMPLRAARRDAQRMAEQMGQAWLDLVLAETAARPLLLVLEDLHWGDLPTVRAIDAALGALEHRPFAVLALARPEVNEVFPRLWGDRGVQEIRLRTLPAKASAWLVRQVLGEDVDSGILERIVKLADGNAFYLEELIRAAHERQGEALPETVVAMVQSRLSALNDEMRRLLRAASVFGEVFWDGGLARLLGDGERSAPALGERLAELVKHELIVRRPFSRFPGESEYTFRHALLREGAYSMLTDSDRKLGHGLAGAWLESGPGSSAEHYGVIGDHFMRAESWDKAVDYLHRAGDAAMCVYAYQEARAHYDRVLASLSHLSKTEEHTRRQIDIVLRYSEAAWLTDTEGGLERLAEAAHLAGTLQDRERRSALARVHMSLGRFHTVHCNYAAALDYLRRALQDAVAMNEERVAALTQLTIVQVDVMQGRWGRAIDDLTPVIEPFQRHEDWTSWILAVGDVALVLALRGRYGEGLRMTECLLPRAKELQSLGATTLAHAYTLYTHFMAGDMPSTARVARATVESAQRSGEMMLVWTGTWMGAWAKANLGDHEEAARDAERAHALLAQLGGRLFIADWFLATDAGRVLLAGRPAEAVLLAEKAVQYARGVDGLHGVALARRFSGQALAALDPPQWDEAEAHLAESCQLLAAGEATMELARTERAWGLVCKARGDHERARSHFQRAIALFQDSDVTFELETTLALAS